MDSDLNGSLKLLYCMEKTIFNKNSPYGILTIGRLARRPNNHHRVAPCKASRGNFFSIQYCKVKSRAVEPVEATSPDCATRS